MELVRTCESCPTCIRVASNPYRREVNDIVVEGCVDSFHDDAMKNDSWHNRPEAQQARDMYRNQMKIDQSSKPTTRELLRDILASVKLPKRFRKACRRTVMG